MEAFKTGGIINNFILKVPIYLEAYFYGVSYQNNLIMIRCYFTIIMMHKGIYTVEMWLVVRRIISYLIG